MIFIILFQIIVFHLKYNGSQPNSQGEPEPLLRISSPNSEMIIVKNENEPISLRPIVESFPASISTQFVWKPFFKTKFLPHTLQESNDNTSNILWLNHTNIYDSGNYTFIATNKYLKKSITFEVYVIGIKMLGLTEKYIKFGETGSIICRTRSCPEVTEFIWSILLCTWTKDPKYECIEDKNHFILNYKSNPDSEGWLLYSSILSFTNINNNLGSSTFGLIKCTAVNKYINDSVIAPLYVGQFDKKVVAYFNNEKINEILSKKIAQKFTKLGKSFNITCEGLKSKYKKNIEWFKCKALKKTATECLPISFDDSNKRNEDIDNEFTIGSTLLILEAEIEDSGLYKCRFIPRSENMADDIIILNLKVVVPYSESQWVEFGIIFFLLIVVIILGYFYGKYYMMRKKLKTLGLENFINGNPISINPEIAINEQAELLSYNKDYEISKNQIQLGKLLGQGAFGSVYMATITPKQRKNILCFEIEQIQKPKIVAVKMLKQNSDPKTLQALGSELKILQYIGKCSYVINLLGAVTKTIHKCELMLIVEYCKYGSLNDFLIDNRNLFEDQINYETNEINLEFIKRSSPTDDDVVFNAILEENEKSQSDIIENQKQTIPTTNELKFNTTDLINWCQQLACGMKSLALKKIVHGDLAARNILLSQNFEIKISDFGLAKQLYVDEQYKKLQKKQLLPIKWYSIEAIEDGKLTTESDVWSYGVVLWELFSLGKQPYSEIRQIDWNFIQELKNGYRLEQPYYTNRTIYNIMLNCWNYNPLERPNFNDLSSDFQKYLRDKKIPSYQSSYANSDFNVLGQYNQNLYVSTPRNDTNPLGSKAIEQFTFNDLPAPAPSDVSPYSNGIFELK